MQFNLTTMKNFPLKNCFPGYALITALVLVLTGCEKESPTHQRALQSEEILQMTAGLELLIGMGDYDSWWSSTEYNEIKAWYRSNSWTHTQIYQSSGSLKTKGFSIRCVKD
jgi:hypothetical protein